MFYTKPNIEKQLDNQVDDSDDDDVSDDSDEPLSRVHLGRVVRDINITLNNLFAVCFYFFKVFFFIGFF